MSTSKKTKNKIEQSKVSAIETTPTTVIAMDLSSDKPKKKKTTKAKVLSEVNTTVELPTVEAPKTESQKSKKKKIVSALNDDILELNPKYEIPKQVKDIKLQDLIDYMADVKDSVFTSYALVLVAMMVSIVITVISFSVSKIILSALLILLAYRIGKHSNRIESKLNEFDVD